MPPPPVAASGFFGRARSAAAPAVGMLRRAAALGKAKFSKLSRVQQLQLAIAAWIALGVLVALVWFWPNTLKSEYAEYQKNLSTGRGSVAFLQQAASKRYGDWFRKAEAGDPVAQLFVGRCYQEGIVVERNYDTANQWLSKSAAQGNDYALHTLALAHEDGEGFPASQGEALRLYEQAAASGNSNSMISVARLYEHGLQGNAEPELALSWYRKSADAGNPEGMRLVGYCYAYAVGVPKTDNAQADKWYKQAADAGDARMIGKLLGDRFSAQFAAYLKAGATDAAKKGALDAIRGLLPEFKQLDLTSADAMYSMSDVNQSLSGSEDLPDEDPFQVLHDQMIKKYIELYAAGSRSQRTFGVANFSGAVDSLIVRWYKKQQYDEISGFWDKCYREIDAADLSKDWELDAYIRQIRCCVCALLRTGKRTEATKVLNSTVDFCAACLNLRPWDWYLKDAYAGLCFEPAAAWTELGEPGIAQPLLRKGWTIVATQSGKEAILRRYSDLPLKGQTPDSATGDDKEFFDSFGKEKSGEKKKYSITRFTIPCDFAGKSFPFFVYVLGGPRGYAELQDQFRWLEEVRGGEVPPAVRASFLRLNGIAAENRVDFRELCVYALATADGDAKKK
jgi:TPR repeat protein